MNNLELQKLLGDIARKYQYLPEGIEKEEVRQLIKKIVKILYGEVENINFDEDN